ncbi:MAG: LacI family DNA-binding transcriptional regulator [Treponema sp.]|nr:LacI family DNA-binding transcriptional regulator [Treponema sp.]
MPTIKDVAEMAGVTVTTVSRMLNNKVNVSDTTKAKINEAMRALNYKPNEVARSLITQKSSMIGLIVPSAMNFFFATVIQYIEEHVSANQYRLLVCVSDLDKEKERDYFSMLGANRVAGVILASHTQDIEPHFHAPLITIERSLSDDIPSICSDNYTGGCLAAEHLLNLGCSRLAYIMGSPAFDMDANKRLAGFSDTLRKSNVSQPVVVGASEQNFIQLDYRSIIETLFRQHPDVDGIFTSNDVIAAQILQYCHRHHIQIPQQLKLISYDDTGVASLCSPALTSVRQPIGEMCKSAVEFIIRASNGETIPSRTVFPVSLTKRETA